MQDEHPATRAIREHAERWQADAPQRRATTAHTEIDQRAAEIAEAEGISYSEALLHAMWEYTIGGPPR